MIKQQSQEQINRRKPTTMKKNITCSDCKCEDPIEVKASTAFGVGFVSCQCQADKLHSKKHGFGGGGHTIVHHKDLIQEIISLGGEVTGGGSDGLRNTQYRIVKFKGKIYEIKEIG